MNKMNRIFFLSASLLFMGCSFVNNKGKEADGADQDSLVFVSGSYSSQNEEGIKVFTFSQSDAGFAYKSGLKGVPNPSFLSELTSNNIIYSVAEGGGDNSFLYSLRYNPDSMNLTVVGRDRTKGSSPCFVMADEEEGMAFTANYSGGNLSIFDIDSNGNIALQKKIDFGGCGTHPTRQEASHIHSVYFSPDSVHLWANDLGTDRIRVIDVTDYSHNDNDDIVLPGGSGPRHLCFHSSGKYAYVITELSGDVVVLKINDGNKAEIIQTVKADTVGGEGSADIHLSPDERFLYASCRIKSDGIAVFRVSAETGNIERVGYCLTGKHPRNFAITPNGKYILVACRDENAIEIYEVNRETGMPMDTGKRIHTKAPVCVRWIK